MLCSETSQLIENHDRIAELSAVHYNLGKTLEDVENIMALPNEAAMAEELLRDDFNLLQVMLRIPDTRLQSVPGMSPCIFHPFFWVQ